MDKVNNKYLLFLASAALAIGSQARADLIANGSFESVTPALSKNGICTTNPGSYIYYSACSAAGWTGSYQIGNGATIGIGGSSFNIPQPDPDGANALILQTTNTVSPSTATQSITIPQDGACVLTFYAANRSTGGLSGAQTLVALLDGTAITGGTYTTLPYTWTLETLDVDLTAGRHSLELEGTRTGAGDVTAFVDDVSLNAAASSAPEPSSSAAFGLLCLGACWLLPAMRHR